MYETLPYDVRFGYGMCGIWNHLSNEEPFWVLSPIAFGELYWWMNVMRGMIQGFLFLYVDLVEPINYKNQRSAYLHSNYFRSKNDLYPNSFIQFAPKNVHQKQNPTSLSINGQAPHQTHWNQKVIVMSADFENIVNIWCSKWNEMKINKQQRRCS